MDSWRVLFPWCKWLRGRLQLNDPPHKTLQSDFHYNNWLLVTLPKHQRNASPYMLPKIRESLTLFSIVALADCPAFCDILREKCGVEGNFSKFDNLRVIFVLDDHTSRSLLWAETVCKILLALDGETTLSEDFLLAKEEVERIAQKKLGTLVPNADILFCLHFAPRDINLVGLQQYLQCVQRILNAVKPKSDKVNKDKSENVSDADDNQETGAGDAWSEDFVSAVATEVDRFLSEDECPRQPLAECFLAVTGGGPRARLFSSTFAPEPQVDESEIEEYRSKVEAIVVNDVDIDDRRFAALCSALRGASGVRELVLESVFVQDAHEPRALKWKWLAYALFTANSEGSSVKKLVITEPQLLADDVAAIASIVNAHKPAQELLDPLWAEHEANQRVESGKDREKDPIDRPEWETSNADDEDMVRLKKNTVVYLEPLCSQDEWLQASVVLENDAEFAIMNTNCSVDNKTGATDEWVEVLVPGYGKCWVHPDVADDRYLSDSHSHDWAGITELSLTAQVAKSSTDKVLTQFFQIIGHDLVDLTLQTNLLREQGLGSILRSCSNLRKLQLDGAQVEDMFAFTHGYDVGYCQIESLSIEHFRVNPRSLDEFAKVLGDPDREAAKHLRQLCVGKLRVQDIDIAITDYENMLKSFVDMLDTNTTLEYLKLYIEGDFYTRFVKSFIKHDAEQLPPDEVPLACKMAFISVAYSCGGQRLEEHLIRRVFSYAARQVTREICIMN